MTKSLQGLVCAALVIIATASEQGIQQQEEGRRRRNRRLLENKVGPDIVKRRTQWTPPYSNNNRQPMTHTAAYRHYQQQVMMMNNANHYTNGYSHNNDGKAMKMQPPSWYGAKPTMYKYHNNPNSKYYNPYNMNMSWKQNKGGWMSPPTSLYSYKRNNHINNNYYRGMKNMKMSSKGKGFTKGKGFAKGKGFTKGRGRWNAKGKGKGFLVHPKPPIHYPVPVPRPPMPPQSPPTNRPTPVHVAVTSPPTSSPTMNRQTMIPGTTPSPVTSTPTASPATDTPTLTPLSTLPSEIPSELPSEVPTDVADTVSLTATAEPTENPTSTTGIRTKGTLMPSASPSLQMTTASPTAPTKLRITGTPTRKPRTAMPTSVLPSQLPSEIPTDIATTTPTINELPKRDQTATSTSSSDAPSEIPSGLPSELPSVLPSELPSEWPTKDDSSVLTMPTDLLDRAAGVGAVPATLTVVEATFINVVWSQVGQEIVGQREDVHPFLYGNQVDISADGNFLAVGEPGQIRVMQYQKETDSWEQYGQSIWDTNDVLGLSLKLSADGQTLVIGSPFYNVDGEGGILAGAGRVQVFQYDVTMDEWIPMGQEINGATSNENFGLAIDVTADGRQLAVGSPGQGSVQTYIYNGRSMPWIKTMARPLVEFDDPETQGDGGFSVALSANGNIMAVGSPSRDTPTGGSASGRVNVYSFHPYFLTWKLLGQPIDGANEYDRFGVSVALSEDGHTLIAGAFTNSGNGVLSGQARVFTFDKDDTQQWMQVGQSLHGEAAGDEAGFAVDISADGSIAAVGSQFNTNNSSMEHAGHVRVYQWDASIAEWALYGLDIDGSVAEGYFGGSVALSADGLTLAAGGQGAKGKGETRVFGVVGE